jgi:hypothetical protein
MSHGPSRRNFVGGLLAALFGWLSARRGTGTPPAAPLPAPAFDTPEPYVVCIPGSITTHTYESTGRVMASTFALGSQSSYVYGAPGTVLRRDEQTQ